MKTLKVIERVITVAVFAVAMIFLYGQPCFAEEYDFGGGDQYNHDDPESPYYIPRSTEENMAPEGPARLQDATRANVEIQKAIEENQTQRETPPVPQGIPARWLDLFDEVKAVNGEAKLCMGLTEADDGYEIYEKEGSPEPGKPIVFIEIPINTREQTDRMLGNNRIKKSEKAALKAWKDNFYKTYGNDNTKIVSVPAEAAANFSAASPYRIAGKFAPFRYNTDDGYCVPEGAVTYFALVIDNPESASNYDGLPEFEKWQDRIREENKGFDVYFHPVYLRYLIDLQEDYRPPVGEIIVGVINGLHKGDYYAVYATIDANPNIDFYNVG